MGQTFRDFADAWSRATDRVDRPDPPGVTGGAAELQRAVRALVRQTPVRTMAHVDALAARVPRGTVARRCADDLVAAGLAARVTDRDAYRFAPESAALRTAVDALLALHARGGTLVRLLGAYATEPVPDARG